MSQPGPAPLLQEQLPPQHYPQHQMPLQPQVQQQPHIIQSPPGPQNMAPQVAPQYSAPAIHVNPKFHGQLPPDIHHQQQQSYSQGPQPLMAQQPLYSQPQQQPQVRLPY